MTGPLYLPNSSLANRICADPSLLDFAFSGNRMSFEIFDVSRNITVISAQRNKGEKEDKKKKQQQQEY